MAAPRLPKYTGSSTLACRHASNAWGSHLLPGVAESSTCWRRPSGDEQQLGALDVEQLGVQLPGGQPGAPPELGLLLRRVLRRARCSQALVLSRRRLGIGVLRAPGGWHIKEKEHKEQCIVVTTWALS